MDTAIVQNEGRSKDAGVEPKPYHGSFSQTGQLVPYNHVQVTTYLISNFTDERLF